MTIAEFFGVGVHHSQITPDIVKLQNQLIIDQLIGKISKASATDRIQGEVVVNKKSSSTIKANQDLQKAAENRKPIVREYTCRVCEKTFQQHGKGQLRKSCKTCNYPIKPKTEKNE